MRRWLFILLLCLFALPTTAQEDEGWQSIPLEVISIDNVDRLTELELMIRGKVTASAWSPDSTKLIVATRAGLWMYDTNDWNAPPVELPNPVGEVNRILWTSDGQQLITNHLIQDYAHAYAEQAVYTWVVDDRTPLERIRFEIPLESGVSFGEGIPYYGDFVELVNDERQILIEGSTGGFRMIAPRGFLIDLETGGIIHLYNRFYSIWYEPNEEYLDLIRYEEEQRQSWPYEEIIRQGGLTEAMVSAPPGNVRVTTYEARSFYPLPQVCRDPEISVYRHEIDLCPETIIYRQNPLTHRSIASLSIPYDARVVGHLMDEERNHFLLAECQQLLPVQDYPSKCVSTLTHVVDFWTGEEITQFPREISAFTSSADRRWLVSFDDIMRVWNSQTYEEVAYFPEYTDLTDWFRSQHPKRSANGQYMIATGNSNVLVWDIIKFHLLAILPFPGNVYDVDFSDDFRTIAAVGEGKALVTWTLPPVFPENTSPIIITPHIVEQVFEYYPSENVDLSPDGQMATVDRGDLWNLSVNPAVQIQVPRSDDNRSPYIRFTKTEIQLHFQDSDSHTIQIYDYAEVLTAGEFTENALISTNPAESVTHPEPMSKDQTELFRDQWGRSVLVSFDIYPYAIGFPRFFTQDLSLIFTVSNYSSFTEVHSVRGFKTITRLPQIVFGMSEDGRILYMTDGDRISVWGVPAEAS